MSAQQSDRWYILPPEDGEDDGQPRRAPKYGDRDGVDGYSGTITTSEVIGGHGGLTTRYPNRDEWYVARFYGEGAVLDDIAREDDVHSFPPSPNAVGEILTHVFPEIEGNWDDQFFAR